MVRNEIKKMATICNLKVAIFIVAIFKFGKDFICDLNAQKSKISGILEML